MNFNTLKEDIFCLSCGYNLRGLRSNGKCPECGAEVEETITADSSSAKLPAMLGLGLAITGLVVPFAPNILLPSPQPDLYEFGALFIGFVLELLALRCGLEARWRRARASPKLRRFTNYTLWIAVPMVVILGFCNFAVLVFFLGWGG